MGYNSGIERLLAFKEVLPFREGLGFNLTLEREKEKKNIVKTGFVEAAIRENWVSVLSA